MSDPLVEAIAEAFYLAPDNWDKFGPETTAEALTQTGANLCEELDHAEADRDAGRRLLVECVEENKQLREAYRGLLKKAARQQEVEAENADLMTAQQLTLRMIQALQADNDQLKARLYESSMTLEEATKYVSADRTIQRLHQTIGHLKDRLNEATYKSQLLGSRIYFTDKSCPHMPNDKGWTCKDLHPPVPPPHGRLKAKRIDSPKETEDG